MTTDGASSDLRSDSAETPFSCRVDFPEEGAALVHPIGELDIHTCPAFQAVMEDAASYQRIVVDLSDIAFMDSTALSVLLVLQRRRRMPLEVVVPQPHLRKLLLITGLDAVFVLHETLADAMEDAA